MDLELVVQAQGGDRVAFGQLAAGAYDRLHHVAYRILRDPQLAEDATQQAVVAIWRKLPQLRDPARFEAWSYRVLVHACANEARGGRLRRSDVQLDDRADVIARDAIGPVDDRDQLERAFRRISVDHRAVVVLHIYLDMPLADVAATLDIPLGTVKSRLTRATAKLRLLLEADAPALPAAPQEVAR